MQQATGSPVAAEALHRIAEFYAIETAIRGQTAAERQSTWQASSLPVVGATMRTWFEQRLRQIPPRGSWPTLSVMPHPLGRPLPFPRRRPPRIRHQHCWACHPPSDAWSLIALYSPRRRIGESPTAINGVAIS